jgi:KDO2-lipid IV(A) lauroyltransferase
LARRRRLPRPARRAIKRAKNEAIFVGFRLVVGLIRLLPHRLSLWLAGILGTGAYYVLWPERRKALAHLAIAFGEEKSATERRRIARRSFVHLAHNFVELVNFERMSDRLDTYVELEDRSGIDRCLEGGKGLIWVTGHIGNWEVLASYFSRHERYKVNVISRRAYDPRMQDLLVHLRSGSGVKTIERGDPRATREIIRTFRRNEVFAVLIDQDTKVQGVFVDFFGRPAFTPMAAATLAYRMEAPVLVGFIERLPDGRQRITYSGPVVLPRTGDADEDARLATAEFTRLIEAQIRRIPEQWIWMHRRWRTRPPSTVKSGSPAAPTAAAGSGSA